jgi:hypothetical protein
VCTCVSVDLSDWLLLLFSCRCWCSGPTPCSLPRTRGRSVKGGLKGSPLVQPSVPTPLSVTGRSPSPPCARSSVLVDIAVEGKTFTTEPAAVSTSSLEWNYAVVFACAHSIMCVQLCTSPALMESVVRRGTVIGAQGLLVVHVPVHFVPTRPMCRIQVQSMPREKCTPLCTLCLGTSAQS